MTEIIICCIMCVILGIILGCICMDIYFHRNYYYGVRRDGDKYLYDYVVLKGDNDIPIKPERQFYDYDLSKQKFVTTGDRHSDTIEKSFSKNDFRYSEEYWKYTFEDGKSKNSDHPLSYEEMKPLTDVHGPVKDNGLEVIKV